MKKKLVFAVMTLALLCLMVLSVSASDYIPNFGEVTTFSEIAQPSILDTTSRVLMSDGKTYPAYYMLNYSTSFSPNYSKINNVVGSGTYGNATVVALEIPEGITTIPSCWSAAGLLQGDKYTEAIEYLKFPSTLTTMGEAAVFSVTTLKVIDNFENTKVEEIPSRGFHNLTSLEFIHLPNTVKTIPDRAFFSCQSVEYIILGANIEYIGTQAFYQAGMNSGKECVKIYISDTISTIYNAYGSGPLQSANSVVVLYYTGTLEDDGMQQIIASPGILSGASSWATVDASDEGFDSNAAYEKSTIIYNYNKCEAFYDGNHSFKDANKCQDICDNCKITEEKENPQHENAVTVQKTEKGYFDAISVVNACVNCGSVEKTENISALFDCLGYSACTFNDNNSVVQGFCVNKTAIEAYRAYVPSFEFGVIATANVVEEGATASSISPSLNGENVISASLNNLKHDYFEIKVIGIKEEKKDLLIVFCAYVTEGDSIYYLDYSETKDSVMGISYNGVIELNAPTKE